MKSISRIVYQSLLAAFTAASVAAQQTAPVSYAAVAQASHSLNWYIGAPVLELLYKDNPALAAKNFNRPSTFVAVTQPGQLASIPAGWDVTPVYTFFDEKKLHATVLGCPAGSPPGCQPLPKQVKGVVLDDELAVCQVFGSNNCTPKDEEDNPLPYELDAEKLTAERNLIYIDVGAAPDPQSGFRFHAGAFADYVDSQIQLAESNHTKFAQLAKSYEEGWNSAPGKYSKYPGARKQPAKIIIGIGARERNCADTKGCKNYITASVSDIVGAVQSTRNLPNLWGYWLNCPSGKPAPEGPGPCGESEVKAMEQFLNIINP